MIDPVIGALTIRGLRCTGRHGSSPELRHVESTYLVDLSVQTDLEPAARSDDLASAVDLAALAEAVREVVAGRSCVLLETLVVRIAESLLARFPTLDQVQVRIRVPDPPTLGAAEESVEMTLART